MAISKTKEKGRRTVRGVGVRVRQASDRYTHTARRPKPPVAVAIAAMMLVWSDRGQWEQREKWDGRWASVARPYHVR